MSSQAPHHLVLFLEQLSAQTRNAEPKTLLLASGGFVSLLIVSFITYGIYNLYFHPLASYPGPRLWAAYQIPFYWSTWNGTIPYDVAAHHEKYGAIVRIAPNELSYVSEQAWNDIYGFRTGKKTLMKDPVQAQPSPDTNVHGLITTPSDADHGRMRRSLTHGFSEKALRDQEGLITVYIDRLIAKMSSVADEGEATDMLRLFNFTTFDIIGDLTFGHDFDSFNSGRDWIRAISLFVKSDVLAVIPKAYPLFSAILNLLVPAEIRAARLAHLGSTKGILDERLASKVSRPDFMSSVLKSYGTEQGITYEELQSTAALIMLAGSETTATTLSAAMYFLGTQPEVLKSLTQEIRSTFPSEDAITRLRHRYLLPITYSPYRAL